MQGLLERSQVVNLLGDSPNWNDPDFRIRGDVPWRERRHRKRQRVDGPRAHKIAG